MKRILTALGIAVAVFSSPISAEEVALPKPNEKWIEVRTPNFRFFSNAGRSTTRQVAIDLEELRAVLAELTDYDLQSPVPTFIYVFKSGRSFLPYKTLYQERPAAVSGYFMSADHANYIAVDANAPDASALVYHEYVHYVANNNMWYLPLWFSEGLAEFYESFEVVGDTVFIGLPVLRHLVVLRGAIPIPLEQLFAVDHRSELYNEADRKGIFYAQSWALVHYLLLGSEERRQQLGTYLQMFRNGAPEDEAFRAAFDTDYESLTVELRGYLRTLRFPSIETTAEIDLDKNFEARRMSYSEVLYRLGDLLTHHQTDRPERRRYFETAVKVDPGYGPPLSALAVEAELTADWEAARVLHERAAKTSPDDAMVFFRWGEFLSRRGGQLRQAVATVKRSTELDPSFAPAWAMLANLFADAGDTSDEAIEAARKAHTMRPSDIRAARDLVRLYLRLDRRAEAVSLIDDALRSDRHTQAEAWTLVIHQDLERAQDLLREDHAVEAMKRLDLAEEVVDLSLYPGVARNEIEWTRRSIKEHQAASHYRRAQELHSQNDDEAAREALGLALELVDDGPVALSSRRLLDRIDNPDRMAAEEMPMYDPSPTAQEIDHLNRLIVAKDFEAALEFLEAMRDRVGAGQKEWLDERIAEIRRAVDYNRYVDAYNRAVELYNAQQYGRAVKVLEALLETLPEGRESESARALLNDALRAGQ